MGACPGQGIPGNESSGCKTIIRSRNEILVADDEIA
jgi:hypothetical protein